MLLTAFVAGACIGAWYKNKSWVGNADDSFRISYKGQLYKVVHGDLYGSLMAHDRLFKEESKPRAALISHSLRRNMRIG